MKTALINYEKWGYSEKVNPILRISTSIGNTYDIKWRDFFMCYPTLNNTEYFFGDDFKDTLVNKSVSKMIVNNHNSWRNLALTAEVEHGAVYCDDFWKILQERPVKVVGPIMLNSPS